MGVLLLSLFIMGLVLIVLIGYVIVLLHWLKHKTVQINLLIEYTYNNLAVPSFNRTPAILALFREALKEKPWQTEQSQSKSDDSSI